MRYAPWCNISPTMRRFMAWAVKVWDGINTLLNSEKSKNAYVLVVTLKLLIINLQQVQKNIWAKVIRTNIFRQRVYHGLKIKDISLMPLLKSHEQNNGQQVLGTERLQMFVRIFKCMSVFPIWHAMFLGALVFVDDRYSLLVYLFFFWSRKKN